MGRLLAGRSALAWLPLALVLLLAAVACNEAAAPVPTSLPTAVPAAASSEATTVEPEENVRPILATRLLRVGPQRVSFLLEGPKAIIKAPEATVTTSFLGNPPNSTLSQGGSEGISGETKQARFHLWPYGIRGAYTTELTFDRPGQWRLEVSAADGDFAAYGVAVVEVHQETSIPDIGTVPPRSQTKTLGNVGGVEELTTDYTPDPELYQVSVADAIGAGKPAVIAFASPAFCTSPTCGPQVDTVSELRAAHPEQANFIHVEIYDNPQEIQGDLSKANLAPAVHEWGLTGLDDWLNESWTFVLNPEGRIQHKFEGFVTLVELEEALQQVLAEG